MDIYRNAFPSEKYVYIHGTLSMCQVVTIPGNHAQTYYRNASCGCSFCLVGSYKDCLNIEQFKECPGYLQMTKHTLKIKGTQRKNKSNHDDGDNVDTDGDLDEEEISEQDSEEYLESDASKIIVSGDIALIKIAHHPYYLLKLMKDPYITDDVVSEDYGYVVPPSHRVVEGHYL